MVTKAKINKWNIIKLKRLCTAKETIHKMKRQLTEWEKIFAKNETDKRLTSKIYKQLTVHTAQYFKNNNTNRKMGRRPK